MKWYISQKHNCIKVEVVDIGHKIISFFFKTTVVKLLSTSHCTSLICCHLASIYFIFKEIGQLDL